MTVRVRVIGVGQRERGDDAAGLLLADHFRDVAPDNISVLIGAADAASLLAQFEGFRAVIVVDCARGGGAPGSILRLPADFAASPGPRAKSSHGNALADAMALGAALGCLPPRLSVFAVVGERFGLGEPLSPAVAAALPDLAALVLREAAAMWCCP